MTETECLTEIKICLINLKFCISVFLALQFTIFMFNIKKKQMTGFFRLVIFSQTGVYFLKQVYNTITKINK